jgi:hypothetical protein
MDITINRGENEKFNFNLFKEIKINEANVKQELINQPSAYAFLTMLHKELLKKLGDLKVNETKAYAKAYIKNKTQTNKDTGRPNSDDLAKQKSELDILYIKAQRAVIAMAHDVGIIESCVRSFEQRASLLQTLSANSRKER